MSPVLIVMVAIVAVCLVHEAMHSLRQKHGESVICDAGHRFTRPLSESGDALAPCNLCGAETRFLRFV